MNNLFGASDAHRADPGSGRTRSTAVLRPQRPRAHVMHRDSAESFALAQEQVPNLASQMRVAFANIALKTGSSSPGELEMTLSTSEVAVCCSSASERSSVRCAAR